MTIIKACTCKSSYQDTKYGKDLRVMNAAPKAKGGKFRCTVCGREHH